MSAHKLLDMVEAICLAERDDDGVILVHESAAAEMLPLVKAARSELGEPEAQDGPVYDLTYPKALEAVTRRHNVTCAVLEHRGVHVSAPFGCLKDLRLVDTLAGAVICDFITPPNLRTAAWRIIR